MGREGNAGDLQQQAADLTVRAGQPGVRLPTRALMPVSFFGLYRGDGTATAVCLAAAATIRILVTAFSSFLNA
jgi:hypothetical protein